MKTTGDIWERCKTIKEMPAANKPDAWKVARRDLVRWIEDELDSGIDDPPAMWQEIGTRCDALVMIGRPVPAPEPVAPVVAFVEAEPVATPDPVPEQVEEEPPAPLGGQMGPRFAVGDRVRAPKASGEIIGISGDRVNVKRDGFRRPRWFDMKDVKA